MRVELHAEQDRFAPHGLDELAPRDDRAAHDVAVARGVLRQAVDEDVDAVLAVVVEACEGVVEHRERAGCVRRTGNAGDVRDARDRIRRRLEIDDSSRAAGEHPLDALVVLYREHRVLDAEALQQALDQLAARPVHLDEAEHVVARLEERQQAGGDGGDTRARRDAVVALLELGQELLQLPDGRVRRPRVEETLALAPGRAERLLEAFEGELDGLVDRRDEGPVVRRKLNLRRVVDARAALHRRRVRAGTRPA